MPREIKSETDIAKGHVETITGAMCGFGSDEVPVQGSQRNSPADSMRLAFESINIMCKNLERSLSGDAGKINVVAEEFEIWDQSGVAES